MEYLKTERKADQTGQPSVLFLIRMYIYSNPAQKAAEGSVSSAFRRIFLSKTLQFLSYNTIRRMNQPSLVSYWQDARYFLQNAAID